MNRPLVIVADADSIVAQAYAQDANHQVILGLGKKLQRQKAHIIFPSTTIIEAVTTLQRKFSDPGLAAATYDLFIDSGVVIADVGQEDIKEARKLFDPLSSKHNTVFDAVVATLAKKYNADAIFSFDGWYRKLGFKLVVDLIGLEATRKN